MAKLAKWVGGATLRPTELGSSWHGVSTISSKHGMGRWTVLLSTVTTLDVVPFFTRHSPTLYLTKLDHYGLFQLLSLYKHEDGFLRMARQSGRLQHLCFIFPLFVSLVFWVSLEQDGDGERRNKNGLYVYDEYRQWKRRGVFWIAVEGLCWCLGDRYLSHYPGKHISVN
jgi:hypothetical protein